ncbi:hypothetical protein [Nonomuraea endophytica]|uniref:hypothetical protein n=1 Tax=Nonomuraea endophytica TaxID=714136 RepID=UPI0037C91B5B
MSAQDSNLSSTGFDYVVAVTQDSINSTLAEYLYGGLPEAILCYVYNGDQPVPIDFATFVANAGNTDPFTVPDGTPSSDARVQNLDNANFAFAVKAKLGLPPGVDPSALPPIVVLKPGQSNVTYTLMFSEFVATELLYGPHDSMTWFNQAQPSGTSWTFSGAVDLDFQDASFTNLPADVQNRLKGVGDPDMFGVQQLYYDLNSSDLEQGFQFDNQPSNSVLNAFMTSDFIDTYWKALGGGEVLGYAAKQVTDTSPSSIAVTDVNFFTPDAVGSENAPLTLNYLCATNYDQLPDTTHAGFGWNWIEPGEVSQYDGVAALNRNTFANYLINFYNGNQTLSEYISCNCLTGDVTLVCDSPNVTYNFNLFYSNPTITFPASGSTIISVAFGSTASDECGGPVLGGKMELNSTYDFSVSVQENLMIISQHLVIYTYIRCAGSGAGGNIVDKAITDVYSIGVDDTGRIVVSPPDSNVVDNSQTPGQNGFLNWFTGVNQLLDYTKQYTQGCYATAMTDIPASFVENFVFPGGSTFSFSDAAFSDNQDLVAHITYADPTQ